MLGSFLEVLYIRKVVAQVHVWVPAAWLVSCAGINRMNGSLRTSALLLLYTRITWPESFLYSLHIN